jgi:Tol biopolymer transport system component
VADESNGDGEGIWQRLRRRKVVQWGLAYAAGAWAFLQVFEYVSESFGWSGQLRQVAILVALIGLPIVLIIAWYHGERGRQRVTVSEVVMIALLAAAGILFSVAATSAWLLVRTGLERGNPLADARFSSLTDFDGIERAAAISRDGKFAAFLSDRDGGLDVWVTQIGTGEFHNLTHGQAEISFNLGNELRNVAFSADGSLVTVWGRRAGSAAGAPQIDVWVVPTMGGPLRRFLSGVAEVAWSSDGTRLAYHPPAPGDPMFVTAPGEQTGRQIYVAPPGTHCHFPVWSPDDEYIYFVRGEPPEVMDIWRVRPDGTDVERMTSHEARVSHPVFIDRRTLAYLSTVADGSGPWLHVLDLRRRESRRLAIGVDRYTSLASSADGRRLLVTIAKPKSNLWRVPISDAVSDASAAMRIQVPTTGGRSPRLGPGYVVYVASKREQDGIWKLVGETATELWSRPQTRIVGGPAISPDGQQIAFTAERAGQARVHVMTADGAGARGLAESLEAHGPPTWAPDGRSIAVAALSGGDPRIFRVPLGGGPPIPIVEVYATDPSWSPTGEFIAFAGPQVGVTFDVNAVTPAGKPRAMAKLTLTRGARRISIRPDGQALVVLAGEIGNRDLALVDLASGRRRMLTSLGRDLDIGDFDVAADGREIVFDQHAESSDVLQIDR